MDLALLGGGEILGVMAAHRAPRGIKNHAPRQRRHGRKEEDARDNGRFSAGEDRRIGAIKMRCTAAAAGEAMVELPILL